MRPKSSTFGPSSPLGVQGTPSPAGARGTLPGSRESSLALSPLGVQGTPSPAGARGVLAHSPPPSGPQARQKHDEWISVSLEKYRYISTFIIYLIHTEIKRENALKGDFVGVGYGNEQIMRSSQICGEKEASDVGTIILCSTSDA